MHINGKCFCGAISYGADIDPDRVVVCHCEDCQALSGSAFEVVVVTSEKQFQLLSGQPSVFTKTGASGANRELAFCPVCGTRLYGREPGVENDSLALRVGTIDQRKGLTPKLQLWCGSALPWAVIDGIPQLEKQGP